ncbi:hypothetical protein G6F56_009098 [Rhizopus delemar]|nr:hypothetical protein G6F56_009098 [Rhizopus delemar]
MPTSQNYRTRRLVTGDIAELNQVCFTPSSSWTYLRDNIQAFYTEKQCECGNQMTIKVRHDTNRPFQWVCSTGPNHYVRISITKGSLFYRLKPPVATIIMVMHEFLAGVQVSATLRHLQTHPTTSAQIRMNTSMVMNHELIARPNILDNNLVKTGGLKRS